MPSHQMSGRWVLVLISYFSCYLVELCKTGRRISSRPTVTTHMHASITLFWVQLCAFVPLSCDSAMLS